MDLASFQNNSYGFLHSFLASVSVISLSEFGDRTFFIAAIMAMRHSRMTVFAGTFTAAFAMTILSAMLGWTTQIIPPKFTNHASTALFAFFGLKMLKESWTMAADEAEEEYEEAMEDIQKLEDKQRETSKILSNRWNLLTRYFSKTFVEAFVLNFFGEWGDRSQISTIVLAARENFLGVTLGCTFGHAVCAGVAVLGGCILAQRISIRTISLIGGLVFLFFALSSILGNDDD